MLKGIAASEGIAKGIAVCIKSDNKNKQYYKPENKEQELERFEAALNEFFEDTKQSVDGLNERGLTAEAGILQSHIEMAKDPFVSSKINEEIENGYCAEEAVDKTMDFFASMFEATGDELTMQRAADIRDINTALIHKLSKTEAVDLSVLPEGTILVTEELTPSMTVNLDAARIAGIITETGGHTSHFAILARALEIPAVLSVSEALSEINNGETVIIDGMTGDIVLSPSVQEENFYADKAEKFKQGKELLKIFKGMPSITASGEQKEVFANIGSVEDALEAKANDAEGIGLFRTEFLYMDRDSAPGEEEQYEAYSKVAQLFSPAPVIIRLLDIGGDKDVPYMNMDKEENPFMGFRAVRYCLENQDIFKTQIRALLRANTSGNIKIMIPMVTTLQEIRAVKEVIRECCSELKAEGKAFESDVCLGIMIETPAAAVTADLLAKEVDFFSIGTNDLIGYMMSADRGNGKVANLYSMYQPAVLRMISFVCEAAHKAGIPVGMCGEAAANGALTPCLLALGLDEFSVSREKVLQTRKNISMWKLDEASKISKEVLELGTANEVEQYLKNL